MKFIRHMGNERTYGSEMTLEEAVQYEMEHDYDDNGQLETMVVQLQQTQEVVAKLARIVIERLGPEAAVDVLLSEFSWKRVP